MQVVYFLAWHPHQRDKRVFREPGVCQLSYHQFSLLFPLLVWLGVAVKHPFPWICFTDLIRLCSLGLGQGLGVFF